MRNYLQLYDANEIGYHYTFRNILRFTIVLRHDLINWKSFYWMILVYKAHLICQHFPKKGYTL